MSLFRRGNSAGQNSDLMRGRNQRQQIFEVYHSSGLAEDYPDASPEELDLMANLAVTVYRERGGGDFTPKQVAIISTLCERLVATNSDLERFVEFLRDVSRAGHTVNPQSTSWKWLAKEL